MIKRRLSSFEEFLSTEASKVAESESRKVFQNMAPLLNPSAWQVFAKILMIHLGVGVLSLSVCHQFGMNPFGTSMSLDRWFMAMWGHHTCMIVCGVLFTSLSFLGAGLFLSIEEVRALQRTEFIQALSVGAVSLVLFYILGADMVLAFSGLWLVGALVGGALASEAVLILRRAIL